MMLRVREAINQLARAEGGAVAPLIAISAVGFISVGALAFDYSRLVALDTELQNAADHAALAAATQLDDSGSCAAPEAAARELVANETRFATDDAGPLVTIPDGGVVCANDTVTVTVAARTVDYALTPVYALTVDDRAGTSFARASARLSSAICKVPPLMMCNPTETAGTPFDPSAYAGKGILAKAGGGGAWAPGNFGFLEVGASPSASNLRDIFGRVNTSFECVAETGVTTAPGNMTAISTAINTRFDIYESGWAAGCGGTDCPPALNTSKDLVKAGGNCTISNNGWRPVAVVDQYIPDQITRQDPQVTSMGHPRDICHAVSVNGDCAGGRVGDGNWDRARYFAVNHPTVPTVTWQSELGMTPTRYQTYLWEIATNRLGPRTVVAGRTSHKAPVCGTGVGPSASTVDRRKASVAVINCLEQSVNGHSVNVETTKWIDVFLVEPSIAREHTSADEIYIEVIGETETAGNGNQGQLVRRDVPYLVR